MALIGRANRDSRHTLSCEQRLVRINPGYVSVIFLGFPGVAFLRCFLSVWKEKVFRLAES